MTDSHSAVVREQFRAQARSFTAGGFAARGVDWLVDWLAPGPATQVLEVAAGAAHLGRALAPLVAHVSALDITPEMLAQGHELARAAGLGNIEFLQGDAYALPWLDDQFDLTVTRLSLHQVADPATVVQEMARVTRPGGQVAVIDMVADADAAVAARGNELERLRDPSHGRTLTREEVVALVGSAGLTVRRVDERDQPLDLEDWMERTATPENGRAEIRAALRTEIDGGAATGLYPRPDSDGAVLITHPWLAVLAG